MLRPCRLVLVVALGLAACQPSGGCTGAYCGTLVFASVGEPDILLPPSTQQVVSRDIEEQLFLKLADIGLSTNTVGDEDFQDVRIAVEVRSPDAIHDLGPAQHLIRMP